MLVVVVVAVGGGGRGGRGKGKRYRDRETGIDIEMLRCRMDSYACFWSLSAVGSLLTHLSCEDRRIVLRSLLPRNLFYIFRYRATSTGLQLCPDLVSLRLRSSQSRFLAAVTPHWRSQVVFTCSRLGWQMDKSVWEKRQIRLGKSFPATDETALHLYAEALIFVFRPIQIL